MEKDPVDRPREIRTKHVAFRNEGGRPMKQTTLPEDPWPLLPETRLAQATPLILVIDDSPTVRKVIEVCLQRTGFAVQTFVDGVAALRWLRTPDAVTPALIYLDIEMPRMDGYEVARALRGMPGLEQTVLIMISSRDHVLDRLKSRLVGAQQYLTKPFKTQDVVALTQSALSAVLSVARTRKDER
jgi:twitching motility two-component system response regulator PilG